MKRAAQQAEWLRSRPEDVLILTETKASDGCGFLDRYLSAFGHRVFFPKPADGDYGVMFASKLPTKSANAMISLDYLPSRVASLKVGVTGQELNLIAAYVPSRDASREKINRKKQFLAKLECALKENCHVERVVFCGDLNILEPNHSPRYSFFEDWEYTFYESLSEIPLRDAFRLKYPNKSEYSWVGRTGDGYRYDHCFISEDLIPTMANCHYIHEPRTLRLSDHSAISASFETNECLPI